MHPASKILSLVAFSVAVQMMRPGALLLAGGLLGLLLLWRGGGTLISMLRRMRWLLVSILLIYAFATPGEYIRGLPDMLAPTYEGLSAGVMQVARLAAMLGALSLLLASSTREQIMAGIHVLLRPLRACGIEPDQFAARLWLTLHYVEAMPAGLIRRLHQHGWSLEYLLQEDGEALGRIQLPYPAFKLSDALVLVLWLPMFWVLI